MALHHDLRPKKLSIVPFSAFLFLDADACAAVIGDLAAGAERFADDGLVSDALPDAGSGLATACTQSCLSFSCLCLCACTLEM